MEKKIFAIGALTMLMAAGCSSAPVRPGPGFGDANAQNLAIQVVNPKPDLTGKEIPDYAGRRDALAIERYETGKIHKPVALRTTSGVISGVTGATEQSP
jgi:hypothetical protein